MHKSGTIVIMITPNKLLSKLKKRKANGKTKEKKK
jgi:hypothetical protein|tara:strand:- start:345 stop:449 length:105 start_codon:yes stop_codon:yes gene_type:complete